MVKLDQFWFLGNCPPSYSSPKPAVCSKREVSDNVDLGEGGWSDSQKPTLIRQIIAHRVQVQRG